MDAEYLRLKEIIEQTFKMEFVSDDQRKAVFASLSDSGKVNTEKRSNKKREVKYGHESGNYIKGAGWYYSEMTNSALEGILTANIWQKGEIEAHRNFANRIKKLNLKVKPIEQSRDVFGGGKEYYTNYIYEKKS